MKTQSTLTIDKLRDAWRKLDSLPKIRCNRCGKIILAELVYCPDFEECQERRRKKIQETP